MLESKQTPTEAALVVAIKAASNVGRLAFARKLLVMHGKAKHRPQESLYVLVSAGDEGREGGREGGGWEKRKAERYR